MWPFNRKQAETRASGTGYTAMILGAREAYISGVSGIGELTASVQSAISLWEGGLSLADVQGTDLLTRHALAVAARSLALRGEAVFLIDGDALIPATDWEVTTRRGRPRAYRLGLPEAGGGTSETALAGEVLHFRVAPDPAQPWTGQAPLRRSSLTAGTLQAIETALAEVYAEAPLGSQVLPFPESPEDDMTNIARGFRGKRGRVLLRESVNVTAAGGPAPAQDWRPNDLTPDLSRAVFKESLDGARGAICMAFGVLPAMLNPSAQANTVREGQRHLAQWMLQPIAAAMAEECAEKLAVPVTIDVMRPLQAFDAGGRARAITSIVGALAQAKEAGVDPSEALRLVDWGNEV